ncbi:CDK5 regulatory subunit associated protein 1 [Coelomomyces lativittatus]|nr:CDK5 regulatory subunit associated protein 1 [Coelomomyces lativittatus]KAJ1517731.1 CDK5 regulatory subunit associated protein 1 [Coelomomyces lativittatus]
MHTTSSRFKTSTFSRWLSCPFTTKVTVEPKINLHSTSKVHDPTLMAKAFMNPTSSPASVNVPSPSPSKRKQWIFDNKMTFNDFLQFQAQHTKESGPPPFLASESTPTMVPYLHPPSSSSSLKVVPSKFYIEVYGCQMNVNDTEILNAILNNAGFQRTESIEDADAFFLMTCAIREGAENKIWTRLRQLKSQRTHRGVSPIVGVLGCMAERLKSKLLETENLVDLVCGPDAYRHLPWLISMIDDDTQVANVMLSADETYADISPLRLHPNSISATLSIMRGCNNMCSFCIVPFTRGIERSRPIASIVDEVKRLSEQGVREVTLLGQNVNSFRDTTMNDPAPIGSSLSPGFSTLYKRKEGGIRFTELLARVADVNPEMRIRFTSPHPKDFPEDLLKLIQSKTNICKQIHLPAQSGSTSCLSRMRRGYTREAYLDLVTSIRSHIPNVALSTDIISGFCQETEEEHQDTLSLMKSVQFDQAFMFSYSMREKTHAHRTMNDDVPQETKSRRLAEIISNFYALAKERHTKLHVGNNLLVLVEGFSRKKRTENPQFVGRNEGNVRVFFEQVDRCKDISVGDYVEVKIQKATGASLIGTFLKKTSLVEFYTHHSSTSLLDPSSSAFLNSNAKKLNVACN